MSTYADFTRNDSEPLQPAETIDFPLCLMHNLTLEMLCSALFDIRGKSTSSGSREWLNVARVKSALSICSVLSKSFLIAVVAE